MIKSENPLVEGGGPVPQEVEAHSTRVGTVNEAFRNAQTALQPNHCVPLPNFQIGVPNQADVEKAIYKFETCFISGDPKDAIPSGTPISYLASVPKFAFGILVENLLSQDTDHKVKDVGLSLILELIGDGDRLPGRELKRIFNNNEAFSDLFQKLLDFCDHDRQSGNIFQRVFKTLRFLKLKSIVERIKSKVTLNTSDIELVLNLIRQINIINPNFTFELPVNEILYQALTLSSNTATKLLKILIQTNDPQQREFDQIVKAELDLPEYTPSDTSSAQSIWGSDLGNTGRISEFVELMHSFLSIDSNRNGVTASYLKNNPNDFGHDFTNSRLGEELINEYDIYEKTGYYSMVNWVKGLADRGYPPHMSLSTVFTLVGPSGKLVTFGFSMSIAINLDMEQKAIEDVEFILEDGTSQVYKIEHVQTDDHLKDLGEYYRRVFEVVSKIFRDKIAEFVKRKLNLS